MHLYAICIPTVGNPDPWQIKLDQANVRIFLPKMGWLRLRSSRPVLGEVRNVTVSARPSAR